MKKVILVLSIILSLINVSKADTLELQEIKLNYKSFFPGGSDPLITQNGLNHNMDKELNLHLNMDFFDHFYWNNMIHSMTDKDEAGSGQFRLVGWNFNLGLHLTDYVDFGYHHFSQHLLDYAGPNHYPVQDAWEINVYIFRKKNPGKGMF